MNCINVNQVLFLKYLFSVVIALVYFAWPAFGDVEVDGKKHVLVVNSYHNQFAWTDNQTDAITQALHERFEDIEIYVEFMDTKRIYTDEYLAHLSDLFELKYKDVALDAIITTDDNALNFVRDHHGSLFENVPVTFCGINNYHSELFDDKYLYAGVVEVLDVGPTIDLVLGLHPNTKRVFVVVDDTPTGEGQLKVLQQSEGSYPELSFEYLSGRDYSHSELFAKLKTLPVDSIVLLTVWLRDSEGVYLPADDGGRLISENSTVAVYGLIDMYFGHGIVGGKLLASRDHGMIAAEMAGKILDGAGFADVTVHTESINSYMFDAEQLDRWGIERSQLPVGSILINGRVSMFDQYRQEIMYAIVVFGFLVVVVLFLLANIMYRRQVTRRVVASEERFRQLAGHTEEIFWLGSFDFKELYYISPAYEKIWGRPIKELEEDPMAWVESVVAEDRGMLMEAIAGLDADNESVVHFPEYRIRRPDGTVRWIASHGYPVMGPDGKAYRIAGVAEDVTDRKEAEQALGESQAMFGQLANNIPEVFWLGSADWQKIFYISPAFEKVWGRTCQELYEQPLVWMESIYEADREKVAAVISGRDENDTSEAIFPDYRIVRPNGELRWISARGFPVLDENGKVYRIAGIAEDITYRKEFEQALAESEDKYRALVENSPDIIARYDSDCRHIFVSHSISRLVPMFAEEMLGKTHRELGFDAEKVGFRESQIRQVFETSRPVENEFEFEGVNGQVILNWRLIPEFGDDGIVKTVLGIASDITAQRKAQRDYERLFTQMIDGFSVHEMIYDESGEAVDYRFLTVNPAFERMTGLKGADIVGKTVLEALPGTEKHWIETYAKVVETGEPYSFANYAQVMGKHFEVVAFRSAAGQFACAFEDVTGRKKAEMERERLLEESEAKNAELERFTYTVSHDLKSPLITIKGYLGMVNQDITNGKYEDVAEDLGRIGTAADHMHRLLDELLELSRIGRLGTPPVEMSLFEVASEAVGLVTGQIAERGVKVEISEDLPSMIGDRPRMVEVFQNLLDNAVKYIGDNVEGLVEVGVRDGESQQVVYVKDNGMGINMGYHDKVFGLFDQLDASAGGTGIGLALVKRIIDVHGGKVWVESEGLGKGSTFCFTWVDRELVEV